MKIRPSYAQDLRTALEAMVRATESRRLAGVASARGSVFILRAELVSDEARGLLQSAARAVLFSRRGSLFEQLRLFGRFGTRPGDIAKTHRSEGSAAICSRTA